MACPEPPVLEFPLERKTRMNRIAFSVVILAIITFIGGILWLTSTSVAGTAAHAITWGLWGISFVVSLIAVGIAVRRR